MGEIWTLQDAKNRFSAVVDAALEGRPQLVTRRGKPVTVVLAATDYERLKQLETLHQPSLTQLLLALPQDDEAFTTPELEPRPWQADPEI